MKVNLLSVPLFINATACLAVVQITLQRQVMHLKLNMETLFKAYDIGVMQTCNFILM